MHNKEFRQLQTAINEISIYDYLEVIYIYRKMILYFTFATSMTSIIVASMLPTFYSSTTKILPPQQEQGFMSLMVAQMGGFSNIASDVLGGGSQADLYVGMLKLDSIKDPIIDRFKLMDVYKTKYRISTYREIDKRVNIMAGKKDGIIAITVEDKDPKLAAEMANAFVEELGRLTIKLNSKGASDNREYLQERLSKARTDLMQAEANLKNFQIQNKAIDITEQAKGTIRGIADLMAQLAVQEVQLANLRRQFTDTSQEVKSINTSITNLKSQISKLESNRPGYTIPNIGSIPSLGEKYVRLTRDFKIQETLVELLTKQYEMAKLAEQKNVSTIQVLQKAQIPDRKSKPQKSVIVMLATVAALMTSVFAAYIVNYYNKLTDDKRNFIKKFVNFKGV